jgi:hypothetical protein
MARHATEQTTQVQVGAPKTTSPVPGAGLPASTSATATLPWGWQVALFVWLSSFVFLCLNDLLACVFKLVSHLAG